MENTKKVKNVSGKDLNVIGIGIVKIDEEVTVDVGFNNANFEIVGSTNAKPQTKSEEKKEEVKKDEEKVEDIIKDDKNK